MSRVKQHLNQFKDDTEGNVLIFFGLFLISFLGIAGFSIDLSRVMNSQSALQNTIDRAATALAKDKAFIPVLRQKDSVGQAARVAYIQKWIDANHTIKNLNPTFSVVLGAKQEVQITADATVQTSFAQLFHIDEMDIQGFAEAVASSANAEIALVLDTTGSMKGQKITDLKAAAKLFTDSLFAQSTVDGSGEATNLKLAVVPFSNHVNANIGKKNPAHETLTYANANWLNKPADQSNTWTYDTFCRRSSKFNQSYFNQVCQEQRTRCNNSQTHPELGCWNEAVQWCDSNGASNSRCDQLEAASIRRWEGCLKPRTAPFNTNDDFNGVGGNVNKKYPGKLGWCNVDPFQPLATEKNTIINKIDDLWAYGETHIPIGLSWGWHFLSHDDPFEKGAEYTDKGWQKYIVLMTDGENTKYSGGNIVHDSDADATMATLCANIKAKEITIFTIAFDINDTSVKDRLKACASKDSYYYDAAAGVNLSDAFANISGTISNLRISK